MTGLTPERLDQIESRLATGETDPWREAPAISAPCSTRPKEKPMRTPEEHMGDLVRAYEEARQPPALSPYAVRVDHGVVAVLDLIRARDAEVRAETLNQKPAAEGDLYDPELLPRGLFRTAARVTSEMGGPDRDCTNDLHRDVMRQDPCQMCAYYRAARLVHAYVIEQRQHERAEALAGFEWERRTSDLGECANPDHDHTERELGFQHMTSDCAFPTPTPGRRRLVGPWEPEP